MTVSESHDVDVLIVGAGFGGLYSAWKFRKLGLKIHLFEASSSVGGVWQYNSYPGARVDSEWPVYQLSIPEVYKTWNFTERFPDHTELRRYFEHVDHVLNVRKDATFNAEVISARFDPKDSRWTVRTANGHQARCHYLVLCTGSTYRRFIPQFPNMDYYKGALLHTSLWPSDGVDFENKNVIVIGAGATGVQVVQEVSKKAKKLTVMIRTPNIALPLRQRKLTVEEQEHMKGFYDGILRGSCRRSVGGYPYNPPSTPSYAAASIEEREALFEELYNRGGFNLLGGVWSDIAFDPQANRELYNFWSKKTRARIKDPIKRDLLAPLQPRHPLMAKRSSLEIDYYECLDQDNVGVIDLSKQPIEAFTEHGIKLAGAVSEEVEADMVILATGYDNYTGSFISMGLKDADGMDLKDRWKDGVQTYLGLMCNCYPNMWMVYGPQAPTAIGNGPTIVELQIDYIADTIMKMQEQKITQLQPTKAAAQEWTNSIHAVANQTLYGGTDSWYMGANIPGKKKEMLNYLQGLVPYENSCREALATWKGFEIVKE